MRYFTGWATLALLLSLQDKPPTIAESMRKLNGGTSSLTPTLALDLKDATPDWEAIQESTREYVKLTAALPAATPKKGDKASWKRLAAAYAANARPWTRRRSARIAAVPRPPWRIQSSCKACHQVHRKKD